MNARIALFLAFCFILAIGTTFLCSRSVSYENRQRREKTVSPDGSVRVKAVSPDGSVEESQREDDKSVRLLDRSTGREQILRKQSSCMQTEWVVHQLVFSPDGSVVATSGDWVTHRVAAGGQVDVTSKGAIVLWDVTTGKEQGSLDGHEAVICMAFSPDGKRLASGSLGNSLWLWDVDRCERLYLEAPWWLGDTSVDYPDYVAFSPDGKTLAAVVDERIGIWDVASGKTTATFGPTIRLLTFSTDGKLVILLDEGSGQSRIVKTWEVPAGVLCVWGGVFFLSVAACLVSIRLRNKPPASAITSAATARIRRSRASGAGGVRLLALRCVLGIILVLLMLGLALAQG